MKKILILIFLISLFKSHSQNDDFKKFHIGVLFSPEYSYRTANKNNFSNGINNRGVFGFQLGIVFDYRVSKWFAIETGFKLAKKGYKTEYAAFDLPTNTHGVEKVTYQNFYIELPLKANIYFLNKSKMNMYATANITPGYLLQGKTKYQLEFDGLPNQNGAEKNENMNRWPVSVGIGIGIDVFPISNLGIRFEPFFQHSILPDNFVQNVYGTGNYFYHWSTGIRFAIFYAF